MRFHLALLLVVVACGLAGFAAGQGSGQDLPSAPSATVQENVPAKQPPAQESKRPDSTPHPKKEIGELKPGDSNSEAAAPKPDSASQNAPASNTSATPAPPAQQAT